MPLGGYRGPETLKRIRTSPTIIVQKFVPIETDLLYGRVQLLDFLLIVVAIAQVC